MFYIGLTKSENFHVSFYFSGSVFGDPHPDQYQNYLDRNIGLNKVYRYLNKRVWDQYKMRAGMYTVYFAK